MKDKQTLQKEARHDFDSLCALMEILRGEGGCPWDREQTHASIRKCLIEETYEVAEAIDNDDPVLLREELGDLLFQAIFHAQIEKEANRFDIDDVIHDITAKMIYRHPHVFGAVQAENSAQVLDKWETIKNEEKQIESVTQALCRVPPHLPALMRAQKIQGKARKKMGFGYASYEEALSAGQAAMAQATCEEDRAAGLVSALFAICAAAEFSELDLEGALTERSNAFIASVCAAEQGISD